jgi:hypothetical protein
MSAKLGVYVTISSPGGDQATLRSRSWHPRVAPIPSVDTFVLNALARSWEGEPPGEPQRNPARTEPRPPGIMQSRLDDMTGYCKSSFQRR